MKLSISSGELSIIDFPLTVARVVCLGKSDLCYEGSLLTKKAKWISLICWRLKDETRRMTLIHKGWGWSMTAMTVLFFFHTAITGNSRRWEVAWGPLRGYEVKAFPLSSQNRLYLGICLTTVKTMYFSKKDSLVLGWLLSCDLVLKWRNIKHHVFVCQRGLNGDKN